MCPVSTFWAREGVDGLSAAQVLFPSPDRYQDDDFCI